MSSSYTMIIPFLPMYLMQELGVDRNSVNLWSGLVFSASFAISAIMAPIWGKLADTKGKRLMAIRASLMLSISYFLGGIVQSPEQLTLMRAFQGFASGLWPMDLAIMTLIAPPHKLGFCLGIMQGVMTAGGVIGPLFGGLLAEFFGMRTSFFVAAAALFINCLMFVFLIKEPKNSLAKVDDLTKEPQFNPWKVPSVRNMLICGTLVQMVNLIIMPIVTTYIADLAGPLDNLVLVSGIVFSLGGFAGAVSAPFWGNFGQHRGFYRQMCYGMVGAGLLMVIQGLTNNLTSFAVMQFSVGLFVSAIYPAIQAVLAKSTPIDFKGRIFGLLFASQQVGCMAAPLIGGAIASFFGMKYVFFVGGFILILLSVLTVKNHNFDEM